MIDQGRSLNPVINEPPLARLQVRYVKFGSCIIPKAFMTARYTGRRIQVFKKRQVKFQQVVNHILQLPSNPDLQSPHLSLGKIPISQVPGLVDELKRGLYDVWHSHYGVLINISTNLVSSS
jgi:hypothetical protein